MNCCRFSIGFAAVVMLVALRVATGWHFFSQGVDHYRDPNWSSEGFLRQAKGPWAGFYKSKVSDFHGFNELVAHPWREVEIAADSTKASAPKNKQANSNDSKSAESANAGASTKPAAANDQTNPPTEGNPQADSAKPAADTTSTKAGADAKKPAKQPTEGDPSPEVKKKEPATAAAEEKLAQDVATARPLYDEFASRMLKDWSDRRHEIAAHYDFSDAQRQRAAAVYDRYKSGLLNYLSSIEDDLYLYQRELRRLDAMQSFRGSADIPFASKRVADKERELANQPAAWLADFRGMERGLNTDIAAIATEEQAKSGPAPQPESSLKRNDGILIWAMIICGGCLIVGLFTRVAAVACAAFLFLVIMSQPPWAVGARIDLFPYQLVEFLALLTLAATAVGRWGGLDFFVHFLITAPFRSRR